MSSGTDELRYKILLACGMEHAAGAAEGDRETGERGELPRESLSGGDDFRARDSRRDHVAFARDGRGRHVCRAEHLVPMLAGIAKEASVSLVSRDCDTTLMSPFSSIGASRYRYSLATPISTGMRANRSNQYLATRRV